MCDYLPGWHLFIEVQATNEYKGHRFKNKRTASQWLAEWVEVCWVSETQWWARPITFLTFLFLASTPPKANRSSTISVSPFSLFCSATLVSILSLDKQFFFFKFNYALCRNIWHHYFSQLLFRLFKCTLLLIPKFPSVWPQIVTSTCNF